MPRLSRLALAALLLPLAACDSGDDDDDDGLAPNTFTLSVGGAAAVTRPDAYNGTFTNDDGQNQFTILLGGEPGEAGGVDEVERPLVALVSFEGRRPEAGRYSLPDLLGLEEPPSDDAFLGIYIDPDQVGPGRPARVLWVLRQHRRHADRRRVVARPGLGLVHGDGPRAQLRHGRLDGRDDPDRGDV